MRTVVPVLRGPDYSISTVTCRDDHTGWSRPEVREGYNLVLPRRGRFRRRAAGVCADIDPTLAYVGTPDVEERFAHPAGGDVCTWIHLRPPVWARLTAGAAAPPGGSTFYVDGRLDLAHRRMLAAARTGALDDAATPHLLELLGGVLAQLSASPAAHPRVGASDRAAVAAAREAILAGHPAASGLLPLAALLAISPFRLSRAFTRELGIPLTRYRTRVRLARALDRLERGEDDLALLAADLGFADQAHLGRSARQQLGHTPAALRRMLSADASGPDRPARP